MDDHIAVSRVIPGNGGVDTQYIIGELVIECADGIRLVAGRRGIEAVDDPAGPL